MNINEIQKIVLSNNCNEYYNIYSQYEVKYWEKILHWVLEYNKQNKVNNCLDIGMAYGTLGLYVKLNTNCNLYGIDRTPYVSDVLLNKYNIVFKKQNIEQEDISFNAKFDIVLFTEILEHLNFNCIDTLLKIKNQMSDNGVLFLSTPDSSSGWGKLAQYNSWRDVPSLNEKIKIEDKHIYHFNLYEIEDIMEIVGFKIDKIDHSTTDVNFKNINIQCSKK